MHALDYARNRIQGSHILAAADAKERKVAIIEHPDVKRQLLNMKVYTEGMRSLLYYYARCSDIVRATEDERLRSNTGALIELLTPIVKGYITDRALEVCSHGVQVYGGYGYVADYPVEQLMRDSLIFMIYEGTNGIQAMDLIGRKLTLNGGQSFAYLLEQMKNTVKKAETVAGLEALADRVGQAIYRLDRLAQDIRDKASSTKALTAYAFAHPFLEVTGDVVFAWMHLWRASVAAPKLMQNEDAIDNGTVKAKLPGNKDAAYYAGQIASARFFINTLLPGTHGKMDAIYEGDSSVEDIADASFGSNP
jgi:hypothetical protein